MAKEIDHRVISIREVAPGLRRFITGLGKKVIIANAMAVCADNIFSQELAQINIFGAWIGAIAYLMQIYFDFPVTLSTNARLSFRYMRARTKLLATCT